MGYYKFPDPRDTVRETTEPQGTSREAYLENYDVLKIWTPHKESTII
jgi:hypothetical protein